MIKEAIGTGRTVEDAIVSACTTVGLPREDLEIEVLDLPRRGFLGLSVVPAKVRVYKEFPDEPAPAPAKAEPLVRREQPYVAAPVRNDHFERKTEATRGERTIEKPFQSTTVKPVDQPIVPFVPTPESNAKARAAADYVGSIIGAMGIEDASITHSQVDGNIVLKLNGDVSGVAIGRRGETLDAIQYLAGLSTNRMPGEYMRVVIDSGNYREKRKAVLEELAKRIAGNVIKSGRSHTLEPMNPYERRIIHSTVSEIEGVSSTSIGDEPNRRVVISAKNPRKSVDFKDRENGNANASRPFKPYNNNSQNGDKRESRPTGGGGAPHGHSNDRNDHGPRREKPQPYKESSVRETAPAEAADKPLYGKINL